MNILVIAEHDNQTLKLATHHCLAAAKQLIEKLSPEQLKQTAIDVLIIGAGCQAVAAEASLLPLCHRVLLADDPVYLPQLAENCAALIAEIGKQYDYILTAATTFGKNLLPRAAALLDTTMISDVINIHDAATFTRPMYAGNVTVVVESQEKIKCFTIRTTAFSLLTDKREQQTPAQIDALSIVMPNQMSRFVNQQLTQSKRPDLVNARVIIAGGRGLKSAENFHQLEEIADCLGAAVGASRAAVDAGFAPNDYQVGQTGKVVAPDLYIAIGISGAIQHLAGMKDSKVVVAINNDPDAPIFQAADYGLVGDLFKILPELKNALDEIKK